MPESAYKRRFMHKQRGFTLIEVMIVVVIVAILAAVAIPSYQNSIQKTRRADAKETLTRVAAAQERYFFTNNKYASDLTELGFADAGGGDSTEGNYTIALGDPANPATAGAKVLCKTGTNEYPCFTLTAVPKTTGHQSQDTECKIFSITHTGKKLAKSGATDTTEKCW